MSKTLLKLYRVTPVLNFFRLRHTTMPYKKCRYTNNLLLNDTAYMLSASASMCFASGLILSAYLKLHDDEGKIAEMRTKCFVVAVVLYCACGLCVLFM